MSKRVIMGVNITDRVHHVSAVQNVLTDSGCYIKTRLGLHEASKDFCSPNGLVLLELLDEEPKVNELKDKLSAIEGVDVQTMVFPTT